MLVSVVLRGSMKVGVGLSSIEPLTHNEIEWKEKLSRMKLEM